MFTWQKIKCIFNSHQEHPWMFSHASNPVPVILNEKIVRVYFSSRDISNRSHITFADIDFTNHYNIVNLSERAIIAPGSPGHFDDSGVSMGCYLEFKKQKFLYYVGWNLKKTVPWQNSIGLAIAQGNEHTFVKAGRAPVMDRNNEDPFSISYPSILEENGILRMWYGSNLGWGKEEKSMNHVIKYAESTDGNHWNRTGQICIALEHANEYAVSKPFVLKIDNRYIMWYSYRGSDLADSYRIGYAESEDGMIWKRKDHLAGIDVSEDDWDSEMICYPSVFKFDEHFFMLYNGNGYGKTGFGLAIAK